jgi:hypothetical protein
MNPAQSSREFLRIEPLKRVVQWKEPQWADPVDPSINRAAWDGVDDLVKDQPQIDQAPRGPGTSGAQVPDSSSWSLRLPGREIDWNDTPWQDDIFKDNEDMQALRTSIVTINHTLTVSLLTMYFVSMYLLKCR